MMLYVFDSNSLIMLGNYFPQTFPSFWSNFNSSVKAGGILSAREVYNEIKNQGNKPHLDGWITANKKIFLAPTSSEMAFVSQIFAIAHFQQLISEKQRLKGTPVADPFVIAIAQAHAGCVVTEEVKKPNAAKMPNICEHFSVNYCNLESFLGTMGWQY